jgi:hypothetical protein
MNSDPQHSMETMAAELWLPIFSQGDDLAEHLHKEKNTQAALRAYAGRLQEATSIVEELSLHAQQLTIETNGHSIAVFGPRTVIVELIRRGLLFSLGWNGHKDD